MTRDVGVLPVSSWPELRSALTSASYTLGYPSDGEIAGWDVRGERLTFANADEAIAFLLAGRGGIQFWRDETHDLFVSVAEDRVILSFDGYTSDEQDELA
jgi:hypothetical protein